MHPTLTTLLSPILPLLTTLTLFSTPITADTVNEGVYLTNCKIASDNVWYSEMSYYKDGRFSSQSGQMPDDHALLNEYDHQSITNFDFRVYWGGRENCGDFKSIDEQFCATIDSAASAYPFQAYAGSGSLNSTKFNCYTDNKRTLYSDDKLECYAVYYCMNP